MLTIIKYLSNDEYNYFNINNSYNYYNNKIILDIDDAPWS